MAGDPGGSEEARALAHFGLAHAIASIERGGPLIPIALTQTAASRSFERHLADRLEESIDAARASVRLSTADRVVVLYDGFLTWDGVRTDAIFAECHELGEPDSHVFARRYLVGRIRRRVAPLGDAVYLGTAPPLR